MGDDGYSLPQDTVPDFRNVPKPQRDSEYSEPQLWNPLQPRSRKDTEDDDDDYDDADLSIKKRGQDFIDSARRLAKRDDERKKSGYVDVDIDKIMANRANQGSLADQMKALSTEQVNDANIYADLSGAVEVKNEGPLPPMMKPAKADRPPSPHKRDAPPTLQPRSNVMPSSGLDSEVVTAAQAAPVPPTRRSVERHAGSAPPQPPRRTVGGSRTSMGSRTSSGGGGGGRFFSSQFLHGQMTKDQADDLLTAKPAGSFLVRISSRKRQEGPNYVLSCNSCHTRDLASFDLAHFPISAVRGSKGWKFSIPAADPTVGFYSLDELISFFATSHPKLSLKYPVTPQ